MSDVHQSLDRHHYQLLLALRDTARLRRAAEILHISPSAASHRLKEAERRLGVTLAVPSGRSLKLTASGRHLADVAAATETALRSSENVARWIGSESVPAVRLAMGFHDSAPWFARYGGHIGDDFRIDVVRVGYGRGPDAVERRSADLHIELVPAGMAADVVVAHDRLMAAVPDSHPAAGRGRLLPEDLVDANYLTAGAGPEVGFEHTEFMVPAGVTPGRILRVESVSLILALVAAGRGLTIQPELCLRRIDQPSHGPKPRIPGAVIVPLDGDDIAVRWQAVIRPDADPTTRTVVDMIKSHFQRRAGHDR
jgi:LysR family transcriptional regulator for metE and metH